MSNFSFIYQLNQYNGALLHCINVDFYRIVDSQDVDWRITTRQVVENAIAKGLPLDSFIANGRFQSFCNKHNEEASFQKLSTEQKLLQWTNSLKMGLPCFIFAAKSFKGEQRKLEDIKLSPLFMFDADHLPCDPKEIYERTLVEGFPWQIALAHITSSGRGLRLVCVARPDLGNIADNQICLANELGILDMIGTTGKPVVDDSCIDASRISYAPRRQDILHIDEDLLFGSENDDDGESQMEVLYGDSYRKGQGHCAPINPNNHFHGKDLTGASINSQKSSTTSGASTELAKDLLTSKVMAFGHPIVDYINTLLPNGAPEGSRHPWMLRLANDLLILCDNDTEKVKSVLLSLKWVNDVINERNINEVDNVISSAKKYKQKREEENLYALQPTREMRRAIEQVTNRKFKELVRELHQQAIGNSDLADQQDITRMLERIGRELEKLFPKYPLLKLLCHRQKRKHYIAAMLVGGAFAMTLMTRCWYKFWPAPGRRCRMNCILELIGRSGSGKHIAVDLYKIMMEPIAKADEKQVTALNQWNTEHDQNNGATKNQTARPADVYRRLPPETSAAAIREAEFNAKETIDGEEWPLHVSIFDSELDNTLRQLKKGYMEALFTLWLKGFHNEPHGTFLKTSSSMVGEYDVHFNSVYTGTSDALGKQATEGNFVNGLLFRITAVPMGDTNYEMMVAHEYDQEDANRDALLKDWAYRLDATKGEIPVKIISDALFHWTERRMDEAKEDDSLEDEDMVKRPCWHAINYVIPFIVSRHWSHMEEEDGRWKCGAGFKPDKTDVKLAQLIANAQYAFQQYFFKSIGEQYYDNLQTRAVSKSHIQQKSILAYNRLPDPFTSEDVDREFGYEGKKGSICSKLKRLQDDGLAQKIRSGEDKGKYRKLK